MRALETQIGGRVNRSRHRMRREKPAHIKALENAFSQHLSTRVAIEERRAGKGKIVIDFYSHDDFERLALLLNIALPR